jgi:hypothetical protein
MTVTQIIRRSDLAPADLKILLPADPSPQAIEQLKHQLDIISSKLLERSNLCEGTKYVSLTGGVLTLLAAVSTGGIGAGVCAAISGIGALSAWWHSGEIAHQSEQLLEFTVKLSNLIEGANSTRLAGLWRLAGSEEFWKFLNATIAASDEYADGLRVKARVNDRVKLLDPNQGTCYRFAETYGIAPEDLLIKLGEFEKTLPSAVTVPVTALPTVPAPSPAATVPNVQSQSAPIPEAIDIVQAILENMSSYAIIGAPGTGKGYVGSHIWRALQSQLGLKIFAIEPKNDLKERGYWDTCDRVYRGTDNDTEAVFGELTAPEKTDWILNAIADYRLWVRSIGRAPHVLVFDEMTSITTHAKTNNAVMNEIKGLISHLTSAGDSSQHYLFMLGHIPNLESYGLNGGEMACLKNLYLYSLKRTDDKNFIAAGKTTFFGDRFNTDKIEGIKVIAERSDCKRAFYFGKTNQWYPMKSLPNLCGYDRDTETFLNSQKPKPETTNWDSEIAILNQRTKTIAIEVPETETNPIADWDNGYIADDEALIEILDAIERKYGKEPFNPSEFYRNTSTKQRNLFGGKIDNFRALLYRAIQEDMAIVEEDDRGTVLIRLF